jgi:hypothetical protein
VARVTAGGVVGDVWYGQRLLFGTDNDCWRGRRRVARLATGGEDDACW